MSRLKAFMDLSDHYFYAEEKKYIAEHIVTTKESARKFATDHKLCNRIISTWVQKWNHLQETHVDTLGDDSGGRPPKLDTQSSISLCKYLKEKRQGQNAATPSELRKKVSLCLEDVFSLFKTVNLEKIVLDSML